MSDGIVCKCAAHSEAECACPDVDWTPQELIDCRRDASRYLFLTAYFIGPRTDLDDVFIACKSLEDFNKVIDEAMAK